MNFQIITPLFGDGWLRIAGDQAHEAYALLKERHFSVYLFEPDDTSDQTRVYFGPAGRDYLMSLGK